MGGGNVPLAARLRGRAGVTFAHGSQGGCEGSARGGGRKAARGDLGEGLAVHFRICDGGCEVFN